MINSGSEKFVTRRKSFLLPGDSLKSFERIYVLVSGGFDSTYLYMKYKELYKEKVYPVNCYNPYEWNKTLKQIEKNDPNFIKIPPKKYKDVIKNAFLNLPRAYKMKANKTYNKKIFSCCYALKHKEFKKDKRFRKDNVVIISGIKAGDNNNRRIWLCQLRDKKTYFHLHREGILYFYPFRDFTKYELTSEMKDYIYKKYPYVEHSGCTLCPVLVLFNLYSEGKRYKRSLDYARKLGVLKYKPINEWGVGI